MNKIESKTIKYLSEYKYINRDIEKVEERINYIEETLGIKSVEISDMPKQHTNIISQPTEEIALTLVELKEDYEQVYIELLRKRRKIENLISQIENGQCRSVLYLRYVEGMTMEEIAEELDMTPRHIYRLHLKAINEIAEKLYPADPITFKLIQALGEPELKNVKITKFH